MKGGREIEVEEGRQGRASRLLDFLTNEIGTSVCLEASTSLSAK
jgi:hypothetical protein